MYVLLHQSNCPADNCHASVIPVASERRFSVTSLQSTMDVDEVDVDPAPIEHPERTKEPGPSEGPPVQTDSNSKKRSNEATNPPSKKKAKQAKNEDSPVLKKLIRELCIDSPKVSEVREKENLFKRSQQEGSEDSARTFLTLYVKIVNAEDKHEVSNQRVIRAYYFFNEALSRRLDHHKKTMEEHEAQRQVNDEVRDQSKNTNTTLWMKIEQARKIYDLFRRIGSDKIQRIRSYSVSSLAKLSWDKIEYVISQISKNTA
ncbi:hypothetical protein C1646_39597 [Rhizophagus diaphanus]|nr:hypothetical protein C1646_39597 [Rhizophagus diaphanus] [Rhizophagus sp. MUCL 43196]